jgi:hypothetical protein
MRSCARRDDSSLDWRNANSDCSCQFLLYPSTTLAKEEGVSRGRTEATESFRRSALVLGIRPSILVFSASRNSRSVPLRLFAAQRLIVLTVFRLTKNRLTAEY